MLSMKNIPAHEKGFVVREVGDETMIISENESELHTLDSIGSFIWKNIDGKKTISMIIENICKVYDIPASVAKKDTLAFINDLGSKNLISIK